MVSRPTAKDICASVSSPSLLDAAVSDIHLADIVPHFHEWEELAPYLDLTEIDEEDIKTKYSGRPRLMRREALRLWKRKNGSKGTYKKLIVVFCSQGMVDVAEKVRDLAEAGDKTQSELLDTVYSYLHDCYIDLPQALSSSPQWPVLHRDFYYVDLELFDAPISRDESSPPPKPITLESMLIAGDSKAKRKVILVEGISGCGKTTLSWYACNQWAAGKLYKNIDLLIHISLSDPDVQSAKSLADLIPHQSKDIRDAVADMIGDRNGKHICFVLDACDEAPQQFRHFFEQFIAGRSRLKLTHVTILLFSRPGLSLSYNQYLTGKVVVKGFNVESLYKYIKLRFRGDFDENPILSDFEIKPELESLCSLPLNAAILVFLYDQFKDNLPNTRTELFYPLLCNHLLRHVRMREKNLLHRLKCLPNDLPSKVAVSFKKVSEIAYSALVEGMMIVNVAFLESHDFSATENSMLGLLQISRQKITMYGDEQYYSFVHLSLQEFLAAFHVYSLDDNGQLEAFKKIFDQNPLSPVLTFYSGLSDLSLCGVRDVLLEVLLKPTDPKHVLDTVLTHRTPSEDPRRHLLALANCSYECKNDNLFHQIRLPEDTSTTQRAKHALEEFERVGTTGGYDIPTNMSTLTFSHMTLLPSDMLSIGKFTRLCCETLGETCLLYLELSWCSIKDSEFKALAIELSKKVDRSKVTLCLNEVCHNSSTSYSLKKLIEGQTHIACLIMGYPIWQQPTDSVFCLKRIIEGLSNDSACVSLDFISFPFNKFHIHSLVLLLRCTSVTTLLLDGNDFSRGMSLFGRALTYSSVHVLSLSSCKIDDSTLLSLGENLCEPSNVIIFLNIEDNPFSRPSLTEFLKPLHKSKLETLGVEPLNSKQEMIVRMVNQSRSEQDPSCSELSVKPTNARDYFSHASQESVRANMRMASQPVLSKRPQHHLH